MFQLHSIPTGQQISVFMQNTARMEESKAFLNSVHGPEVMLSANVSTAKTSKQQGNPDSAAHAPKTDSQQSSDVKHQHKEHNFGNFLKKEEHKLGQFLKKEEAETNADNDKYAGLM